MRTSYLKDDKFKTVLMLLTPQNRLAIKISLETGARINDILSLKTADIQKRPIKYVESKTQKKRTLKVSKKTLEEMRANAGEIYLFPNRNDYRKHRTRQAVWKDIKRAKKALRIKENIAPHSARKTYAVRLMKKYNNDIAKVQRELNHSTPEVTMIYALSGLLSSQGIDFSYKL